MVVARRLGTGLRAGTPQRNPVRHGRVPGVLGGRLQGSIETGGRPVDGDAEFVLSCVSWKRGYRGSTPTILWQDQCAAAGTVTFEIPFDVRPTSGSNPGSLEEILWLLNVRAVDGEFQASFTVPVFQTAESDATRTRQRLEAAAGSRLTNLAPSLRHIEKIFDREGAHYHLAPAPNRSIAIITTLFGLAFLGFAALLLLWLDPASRSAGSLSGTLLMSMVGIGLLLASVWLWFGEVTVTASRRELRIQSSCLGLSRTKSLSPEQIRGFEIRPSFQKGAEVWYEVVLQLPGDRSLTCRTGVDKAEAEWFVAEVRKDLGIADS
jgi:hypothetical protein